MGPAVIQPEKRRNFTLNRQKWDHNWLLCDVSRNISVKETLNNLLH